MDGTSEKMPGLKHQGNTKGQKSAARFGAFPLTYTKGATVHRFQNR